MTAVVDVRTVEDAKILLSRLELQEVSNNICCISSLHKYTVMRIEHMRACVDTPLVLFRIVLSHFLGLGSW